MVVGRGHFAVPGGGRGQGADCRVLAVATRVLGRGGFCRLTVTLISFGESVIWRQPHDLFRVAETGGGII